MTVFRCIWAEGEGNLVNSQWRTFLRESLYLQHASKINGSFFCSHAAGLADPVGEIPLNETDQSQAQPPVAISGFGFKLSVRKINQF
ncbi:hypothetical protein M1B72_13530 [Geomonas paludis]|uniref:Uncharacterized protein n=1 Tax=Geomonas paludis TaxID=2740185 RepID=A0ABY4LA42_9BACT|nr:hypothetical protein [Geomonas paludis]UPU34470.1 hypothetical protein M1B72_13530 [Geomonas paludis]